MTKTLCPFRFLYQLNQLSIASNNESSQKRSISIIVKGNVKVVYTHNIHIHFLDNIHSHSQRFLLYL